MPSKYSTIIFVPHARARFRKLRISDGLLYVGGGTLLVLLLAALGFGIAFFTSMRRDREYRRAMAENERLRQASAQMENRLLSLSKKLDDFEDRTHRLAIVAGLANLFDAGRGGVGGPHTGGDPDGASLAERSRTLQSQLARIESRLVRQSAVLSSTPTIEPVRGLITSGFGARVDPFDGVREGHPGVDISTRRGNPVIAPADGIVVRAGWWGGYGRVVEISHGFGYRTLYGHLDEIRVEEGQHVHRGDVLGLVGSTGRSTGPHLHYEVWVDNRAVNPLQYILR
jgi:murein DD-endopeptidase MepM/ murein hydrolase activator NlpD